MLTCSSVFMCHGYIRSESFDDAKQELRMSYQMVKGLCKKLWDYYSLRYFSSGLCFLGFESSFYKTHMDRKLDLNQDLKFMPKHMNHEQALINLRGFCFTLNPSNAPPPPSSAPPPPSSLAMIQGPKAKAAAKQLSPAPVNPSSTQPPWSDSLSASPRGSNPSPRGIKTRKMTSAVLFCTVTQCYYFVGTCSRVCHESQTEPTS